MDSDRFDAWTRRNAALGIGGLLAGLLGGPHGADAGKKKGNTPRHDILDTCLQSALAARDMTRYDWRAPVVRDDAAEDSERAVVSVVGRSPPAASDWPPRCRP